jgi:hypothetical protein
MRIFPIRVCPGRFLHLRCLDASLAAVPSVRPPIFAETIHAKVPLRSGEGSFAGRKSGDLALWWLYTLARMDAARQHGRLGLVAKLLGRVRMTAVRGSETPSCRAFLFWYDVMSLLGVICITTVLLVHCTSEVTNGGAVIGYVVDMQ